MPKEEVFKMPMIWLFKWQELAFKFNEMRLVIFSACRPKEAEVFEQLPIEQLPIEQVKNYL